LKEQGKIVWQCPSNIALVKYWGKRGNQLPSNASISFVLDNAHTTTSIEYRKHSKKSSDIEIEFYFDGKLKESFSNRVLKYFEEMSTHFNFLRDYHFKIDTENNFPHSSGIASSASAMGALSLGLCSMGSMINEPLGEKDFYQKASFLARLGSGSACRSLYKGFSLWGEHKDFKNSSDEYAIPINDNIHSIYNNFKDTVLLLHKGEKEVSSSTGHELIKNHPFRDNRFQEAGKNITRLKKVLENGDLHEFIEIVEAEALMLHALMMTSSPAFILFQPNTIEVIKKVWAFRKETKSQLMFTLDAGANVHLLYPEYDEEKVVEFIKNDLLVYCENGSYIRNEIGNGPIQITT
jgi:diphosphomevalonate decarboxylase